MVGPVALLCNRFSDWHRLKKSVAVLRKVATMLKDRASRKKSGSYRLTTADLEEAERTIFRWVHRTVFPSDVKSLSQGTQKGAESKRSREKTTAVDRKSPLTPLNPYLKDGILRVGGRLSRARMAEDMKHPIILPRKHPVTTLIVRAEHKRLGHAGRGHVLASLRQKYWLTGGTSSVR